MQKKRDRLQVIHDILKAIEEKEGEIKPTHLLYKSNLSHKMMEEYIKELLSKEFITENKNKKGRTYSLAKKGLEYLKEYKFIINFIDSFDLN